jgi:hypothetical protein
MAKRRKSASADSSVSLDGIFAIAEPVAFAQALSERVYQRWHNIGFDALAPGEKLIIRLNAFVGEINTNGFDGLLFNCTGDCVHEIYDDLLLLGARRAAGLVKEAIDFFPKARVPKDESTRREFLLSLAGNKKSEYEALVSRLSEAIDQPETALDLSSLVSRYARRTRFDFEESHAEPGATPRTNQSGLSKSHGIEG